MKSDDDLMEGTIAEGIVRRAERMVLAVRPDGSVWLLLDVGQKTGDGTTVYWGRGPYTPDEAEAMSHHWKQTADDARRAHEVLRCGLN